MQQQIFGEIAEVYDEVRPGYPDQLISDIVQMSGVNSVSRVLEVGCGSGIATRLLAPLGFELTSIDPAAGMLDVARRTSSQFRNVTFVQSTFEEFESSQSFDLIVSAQAFHWIDPRTGYAKLADLLRPQGSVALFWNTPQRENAPLDSEINRIYRDLVPDLKTPAAGVGFGRTAEMIEKTRKFSPVELKEYRWTIEYDADTWIRLLGTHSDHRVLTGERRARLFDAIRNAIIKSGSVHRISMLSRLNIARLRLPE